MLISQCSCLVLVPSPQDSAKAKRAEGLQIDRFRENQAVGDCQTQNSSSEVPVIMEWWEHSRDPKKGPMAPVLFLFAVL